MFTESYVILWKANEKAVARIPPHHGKYCATDHTIAYSPT